MGTRRVEKAIIGVMLIGSLVGCAITPEPLTEQAIAERAQSDLSRIFGHQPGIKGPITLAEAERRAIEYNLDHRVKMMEEALAQGQFEVARYDLLPQLAASAGYSERSNQSGASSRSIATGLQSLASSTSQDRSRKLWDVGLVWNVLDFGVSYAQGQQSADEVLISQERRRKVTQNILQDVRAAWWRAVTAEQLIGPMDALLAETRDALDTAKTLEAEQIGTPTDVLNYQKGLLETVRELWNLRRDLTLARTELATLMNIRPGTPFELPKLSELDLLLPSMNSTLEEMELQALTLRPELREEDYRKRISRLEVRKAMLRMLPGLEFSVRRDFDSNSFLFNNQWTTLGLQVSWNVFQLFSGPAAMEAARTQVALDDMRRMALSVAVLTQVHLSAQRLSVASENYNIAAQLANVGGKLEEQALAGEEAQTTDVLSVIRRKADALVGQMRRGLAYAEVQNAYARLRSSLGLCQVTQLLTDGCEY